MEPLRKAGEASIELVIPLHPALVHIIARGAARTTLRL